jgi:hypothetical protein
MLRGTLLTVGMVVSVVGGLVGPVPQPSGEDRGPWPARSGRS